MDDLAGHDALGLAELVRTKQVTALELVERPWLTPTLAEPPLPLGSFDGPEDEPAYGLFRAAAFVPFTPIANITGQPAMSVPLAWSEGLPVGVHFVGRFGDEATLCRLVAQLDDAQPRRDARPPVSV